MPDGSSHHFDGLQDGPNVDDDNLNSLDAGANVHPRPGLLQVDIEPGRFVSSSAYEEYAGATAQPVPASTVAGVVYLTPGGGTPVLVIAAGPFPGAEHMPLAEFDTDTVQVLAIRDKRARVGTSVIGGGPPSGVAAGVLAGTYPAPAFAAGALVNVDVNAGAAIVESKLALNNPTHSAANDPTADEKAALAGTGTPSGGDLYVNNSDARMTDARAPTAHASDHQHGGGDEVAVAVSAPNAIPKAGAGGKLDNAWINRQVRGDDRQAPSGAEARTTTTLVSPGTVKLQLLTGAVTGTYRIDWQAEVDNNNVQNFGQVRVQNTTTPATLDSHDYGSVAIPLTDPKRVTGFFFIVLAGVGQTIEIQHHDNAGGNTQGVAKARMEMRRVA